MQISTRYGFAFLCAPKCASTAVESSIRKYCNISFSGGPAIRHMNARFYTANIMPVHQALAPQANIESFSLMREPLEWIASWYRYRTRAALRDPTHPNHENYTGHLSYDEFISEYLAPGERQSFAKLPTQFDFVSLSSGAIGIDHVMPTSKIRLVSEFLSNKIGRKIKIPRKNVSPKMPLELDATLEHRLREHLRRDIALYAFVSQGEGFNRACHGDRLEDLDTGAG